MKEKINNMNLTNPLKKLAIPNGLLAIGFLSYLQSDMILSILELDISLHIMETISFGIILTGLFSYILLLNKNYNILINEKGFKNMLRGLSLIGAIGIIIWFEQIIIPEILLLTTITIYILSTIIVFLIPESAKKEVAFNS